METEKEYFSSHQMGSYPPIIIGAILGFFPILGAALAVGAIWVSCYSYIYEGASLYSALEVLLFTLPGACFFCIIGWMFLSEGLAQYRFTRNGLSVKYPLRKKFILPWDAFQQVCVCYAAYTTRGPRRANTILCCVKKGQKKNIYGRWKTDNTAVLAIGILGGSSMHRKTYIVLLMLLCGVLIGCNNHNSESMMDYLAGPQRFSYVVSTELHFVSADQNHIEISYPTFDHQAKSCSKLNLLVENAISDYLSTYGDDVSNLSLSANYEITYADDSVISIVFRGESDVKGTAHPIQFAFAVNILAGEPKIAEKTSLAKINDHFVQDMKTQAMLHNNSAIKEYFVDFTTDEIKHVLQQEDVSLYLTDQGVGVIFPVPHPIGDYVEFLVTD